MSGELALLGGRPTIPPETQERFRSYRVWPIIDEGDVEALTSFLRQLQHRERRTGGSRNVLSMLDVEAEYASYVGTRYCLATASGTAALHLSLAGCGVEQGDEVITPALSFVASATCILHQNAIPVFVDVDPDTYNIDPRLIEAKITGRTRAILAVNLHGLPADYHAIRPIARRYGLAVVEDGSQSHGASYHGVRSGALGDTCGASIVSNKLLPSLGEGGFLTTDSREVFERAKTARLSGQRVERDGELVYDSSSLGWSCRPNEINLRFAERQMAKLDSYNLARSTALEKLSAGLRAFPALTPPRIPEGVTHGFWAYRLRCDPAAAGIDLDPSLFTYCLRRLLQCEGVPTSTFQTAPLPYFQLFRRKRGYGRECPWRCTGKSYDYAAELYPNALRVIDTSFCLFEFPVYPFRDDVDLHLEAFAKVFRDVAKLLRVAELLRDEHAAIPRFSPAYY